MNSENINNYSVVNTETGELFYGWKSVITKTNFKEFEKRFLDNKDKIYIMFEMNEDDIY